ncbi:MAG: acetate/propionate family kinase [Planctomycetes bacterium]|nr:acetate/propionate family kinase [Planctomycetota bacterium]
MKILVSNIGSTSFKFRLFEISGRSEQELAQGGADRIGGKGGVLKMSVGASAETSRSREFPDHGSAITFVLDQLVAGGALKSSKDLGAVAFKAVMGGDLPAVALVTDEVLATMEYFIPAAPMHNPPYIAAMKMFRKVLSGTSLVAAFEPGFHRSLPDRRRYYAVPPEWAEKYGVRKYGFHGASHCYIATRTVELMGRQKARRIISIHLGGSSSICAIRDGASMAVSMGLSPQTGLPQANRAGDFDIFALPLLKAQAGMDTDAVLKALGSGSGLAALSGTSGDMRDIKQAADAGSKQARLAMDLFITAIRDYIGAYLLELGGADAIVFTGGIGQHNPWLREAVCCEMEFAGIKLDAAKNESAKGEARFDADGSTAALWVMPTNEELIVARQAAELLTKKTGSKNKAKPAKAGIGERQ